MKLSGDPPLSTLVFPRFVAIGRSSSGHSVLAAAALGCGVEAAAEGHTPLWLTPSVLAVGLHGGLEGDIPGSGCSQTLQMRLQLQKGFDVRC